MKKGVGPLVTAAIGVILAMFILWMGYILISTALNLADEEDIAVNSIRAIATSITQSTSFDRCSSAEISIGREYQIKSVRNEIKLIIKECKENCNPPDDGTTPPPKVYEERDVDSIKISKMSSIDRIYCKDNSPTCRNVGPGLEINPNFNREVDGTFCVCFGDWREDLVEVILQEDLQLQNVAILYPKSTFDLTCDNPVSEFQAS